MNKKGEGANNRGKYFHSALATVRAWAIWAWRNSAGVAQIHTRSCAGARVCRASQCFNSNFVLKNMQAVVKKTVPTAMTYDTRMTRVVGGPLARRCADLGKTVAATNLRVAR